jgi:alpha-1,2-mannosyltransferase
VAGICLALMSVKPQFAMAFGVFLLFTGRWRALLWSFPATACLVGLSVAAFGMKPWINFVEWTMPFHATVLSVYAHEVLRTVVSLYSAARLMGFSASVGYGLQYVYAMVVLIWAAALAIRCGMTPRVVAIGLLSVLTALPYFSNYDLAIAAPALTIALFASQPGEERPFLTIIPASLLWMAPVFSASFDALSLPVVSVGISVVLLLAMYGQTIACRGATPSVRGFAFAARLAGRMKPTRWLARPQWRRDASETTSESSPVCATER